MGVLQTAEVFIQAPSAFYPGKKLRVYAVLSGGNEIIRREYFLPGMSYHNFSCVENMF